MRAFDLRNSWLDNDGKPLAGRIVFCKLHTNTLENIYDYLGRPLSNPIFTNTIGQPDTQVFLGDELNYTIRFDKYVGNSDMSIDQDNWLFQYSCDNLYTTYTINIDSDNYQLINNIDALRLLNPDYVEARDDKKIVALAGYNEPGDKPIVYYIWSNETAYDNGGSIITVSGISGHWELLNTFSIEGFDVRHFGIFGADSMQDADDNMSLQISRANTYASSIGAALYFPAIDGLTWYKMNNLNLGNSIFAEDTKVFGNTGTNTTIRIYNENSKLDVVNNSDYNGIFTIVGSVVKTSWGENSTNCKFQPSYKLIVDSDIYTYNRSFSNIVIDCQYGILTNANLYNCQIFSVKKIGDNNTFRFCTLTESMFSDTTDFDSITVYDDDIIDLDDWPTTSKWLTLVAQNTTKPLDFKGRTLDSTCDLRWTVPVTYINANFDNYEVKQNTVIFEKCTGIATATSLNDVTSKNSTLTITDNDVGIMSSISCTDSIFALVTSKSITTASMLRSTFASSPYRPIVTLAMRDSVLNSSVTATTITLINTEINDAIQTGPAGFYFENCVFNAAHTITVSMLNTIVSGTWLNNRGNIANPININVTTGSLLDESYQTYKYEGNFGTFLPSKTQFVRDFPNANVENKYYSSNLEPPTYGNVGFYIRDSIIRCVVPYIESKPVNVFHVGNNGNYLYKMKLLMTVVYNGVTWHPTVELFKTHTSLDENVINGYSLVPLITTYAPEVGTTTVHSCKFIVEVEKI